jgi:hypothetical protein
LKKLFHWDLVAHTHTHTHTHTRVNACHYFLISLALEAFLTFKTPLEGIKPYQFIVLLSANALADNQLRVRAGQECDLQRCWAWGRGGKCSDIGTDQ